MKINYIPSVSQSNKNLLIISFSSTRVEIPTAYSNVAAASNTSPGPKYNVLDDGTLMIQNASGEDEGEYECMARNAVGEATTRAVSLRYFGAPSKSQEISVLSKMS